MQLIIDHIMIQIQVSVVPKPILYQNCLNRNCSTLPTLSQQELFLIKPSLLPLIHQEAHDVPTMNPAP